MHEALWRWLSVATPPDAAPQTEASRRDASVPAYARHMDHADGTNSGRFRACVEYSRPCSFHLLSPDPYSPLDMRVRTVRVVTPMTPP